MYFFIFFFFFIPQIINCSYEYNQNNLKNSLSHAVFHKIETPSEPNGTDLTIQKNRFNQNKNDSFAIIPLLYFLFSKGKKKFVDQKNKIVTGLITKLYQPLKIQFKILAYASAICAFLCAKQLKEIYYKYSIKLLIKDIERGFETEQQIEQLQNLLFFPINKSDLEKILFKACFSRDLNFCKKILAIMGENYLLQDIINSRYKIKTPLHILCERTASDELLSFVSLLLKYGADPAIPSPLDMPLEVISKRFFNENLTNQLKDEYLECIKLLVDKSFDYKQIKTILPYFSVSLNNLFFNAVKNKTYVPQFFKIATLFLYGGADPNVLFGEKNKRVTIFLELRNELSLYIKNSSDEQNKKFLKSQKKLLLAMLSTGANISSTTRLSSIMYQSFMSSEQLKELSQTQTMQLSLEQENHFREQILHFDEYDCVMQNSLFNKLIAQYPLPGFWLARIISQLCDHEKRTLVLKKLLPKFINETVQLLSIESSPGKQSSKPMLKKLYDLRLAIESCIKFCPIPSSVKAKKLAGKLLVLIAESGCYEQSELYEIITPLILPLIELKSDLCQINQVGYNIFHLFAHGFDNELLKKTLETAYKNNFNGLLFALTAEVENRNFTSTQTPLECAISFMCDGNENAKGSSQFLHETTTDFIRKIKEEASTLSHSPYVDFSGDRIEYALKLKRLEHSLGHSSTNRFLSHVQL